METVKLSGSENLSEEQKEAKDFYDEQETEILLQNRAHIGKNFIRFGRIYHESAPSSQPEDSSVEETPEPVEAAPKHTRRRRLSGDQLKPRTDSDAREARPARVLYDEERLIQEIRDNALAEGGFAHYEEKELSEREAAAREAMQKLIMEGIVSSSRRRRDLLEQCTMADLDYQDTVAVAQQASGDKKNVGGQSATLSLKLEQIQKRKNAVIDELEALKTESPESFFVVHGLEFRDRIRELKRGELVRTPYVQEHMDRIVSNIKNGRATLVHGHLGSGKTELAVAASKHAAAERRAKADADLDLDDWLQDFPDASKEEQDEQRLFFYQQRLEAYLKIASGSSAESEMFSPVVISGSADLTTQELFGEKTLKIKELEDNGQLEAEINARLEAWKAEHPNATPDEIRQQADIITNIYCRSNGGTEVQIVHKGILKAMEEGRTVIIDEANAIPPSILIALNNILNLKAGETVHIATTGEDITIKEGFAIIITGNLSSGDVTYGGTETLNPAFMSRFDKFEHSYLPMNDSGEYSEQSKPEENELFEVVLAKLADKNGNLLLPLEGGSTKGTLDKLFKLCQFAHITQDIFRGAWEDTAMNGSRSGDAAPELTESVLSIRDLLNVLEIWNSGVSRNKDGVNSASAMDIDTALWKGFIEGVANPSDQQTLIEMAIKCGFFNPNDGWHTEMINSASGEPRRIEDRDMRPERRQEGAIPEKGVVTLREVLTILHGPAPAREFYPDIDLDTIEDAGDEEITYEDIVELQEKLKEYDTAIKALEVLYDQCGCNVPQEA